MHKNPFDSPQSVSSEGEPERAPFSILSIFAVRAFVLTLVTLLVSSAFYSGQTMSWGGGDGSFHVDSEHYEIGVPRWLTYNNVSTSGELPSLPDKDMALPGFHVKPFSMFIAVTIAVSFASISSLLSVLLIPPRELNTKLCIACGLLAVASSVIGAFIPTDPRWIALILLVILAPIFVTVPAGWIQHYSAAILLSFVAATTIWCSFRFFFMMAERDDFGILRFPDFQDLLIFAFPLIPSLILSMSAVCLVRFSRPKASNSERSEN